MVSFGFSYRPWHTILSFRRSWKSSPFPPQFSSLHQPFPAAIASLCAIKPATLAWKIWSFWFQGETQENIKNDSNPNKCTSFRGDFLRDKATKLIYRSSIPSGEIPQVSCWMIGCIKEESLRQLYSPKRQKPSSPHSLQLLRLPLKSCHISALLFVPSAWYPKGTKTGDLSDLDHPSRNVRWLSKEVRDEQLLSLLQFSCYHPKSTSTIHPGPRKERRQERRKESCRPAV